MTSTSRGEKVTAAEGHMLEKSATFNLLQNGLENKETKCVVHMYVHSGGVWNFSLNYRGIRI